MTAYKYIFYPLTAFLLAATALVSAGCNSENNPGDKIGVSVSILPQAEWVKAIGGEHVEVNVLIPPGADPHTYNPKPSQMKALAKSKIYAAVGSGIEFELSLLEELLDINPSVLLVDCSEGVELIEMGDSQHNDEHASSHPHSQDPHIWLSLSNVSTMATNIYNGLAAVDPENKDYYRQNLDSYLAELDELDHTFRQGFAGLSNRVFIIQHPSLGYFARDYNLTQVAAEEGGSDATPKSMERTIKQARENNIKIIFVSPQFPPNVADTVAREINGVVEPLDSLAPNYKENMEHIYNIMLNAMNDGQLK